MWRVVSRFAAGLLATVLPVNAISVYILHDVDKDRVGRWNLAFFKLCEEFLIFSVLASVLFLLCLWVGRALLRKPLSPDYVLAFWLGVAVILVQYPIELAARALLPSWKDTLLLLYPLLSPLFCAILFLWKGRKTQEMAT
jgi:hypothetical protein